MRRTGVIIALTVFILLTGLVLWQSPKTTARIQAGVFQMIAPFMGTGNSVRKTMGAFTEGLKTLEQLEKENAKLTVENKELRAVNQVLRDLESENNQLKQALAYRQKAVFKLVPARIIGRDSSSWWSSIQIDRGSDDGITMDMPVLTDIGLVGKTSVVSANTAKVILLVDENCKVAASVEGTQEQGIVSGSRISTDMAPDLRLRFLPKLADLRVGQQVTSSGVGEVFPAGLLLGIVSEVQVRELDAQAKLKPAVDFSTLQDVFVVVGRK